METVKHDKKLCLKDVLHVYSGATVEFVNPFMPKRFPSVGKILFYDPSENTLRIEEKIGDTIELHDIDPDNAEIKLKTFKDFTADDFKKLVINLVGQQKGCEMVVYETKPKAKYRKLAITVEGEPVAIFTLQWNWVLLYKDMNLKKGSYLPTSAPGDVVFHLAKMGYNVFFS